MLRVGFVGAGRMATRHSQNIKRIGGGKVVAVCDLNPTALASAQERMGVEGYADLDEMLRKEDLDAVYVCIPIGAHGDVEERIAEEGINMFIEKPLSPQGDVARRIAESIERAGVLSSVGYHWRYSEATDLAMREIEGRDVGMVLGFWMTGLPGQPWWGKRSENPAQIFEQTTHLFDLSRYLVGEISEVSSLFAMRCMADVAELEDVSIVSLLFENGAIGSMNSTYMIRYREPLPLLERWTLSKNPLLGKFARGTNRLGLWERSFGNRSFSIELMVVLRDLVLQIRQASLVKTTAHEKRRFRAKVDPYRTESRAFLRAVASGEGSGIRSSYRDALKTHETVLGAIKSAERGKPVRFD